MRRRTVLKAILAAAAATVAPRVAVAAAVAVPPPARLAQGLAQGGSGTAKVWRWVALPNSGGLQVYCTDANGATGVAVTWTADGVVTAAWPTPLTVRAPAGPGSQAVASGDGYGLAVCRALNA